MKVIHFVPYYPPDRLGGVGEYAARLHQALLDAGHESLVVTRGTTPGPHVTRIARSALGWFLRGALEAGRAARADVVHVHAGEALPLLLALALRSPRARILATFHVSYAGVAASLRPYRLEGQGFGGGPRACIERRLVAPLHRAVDAIALRLADAVAPITRACAREVLGADRAQTADVIYHGLPELAAGPSAEAVELLYVGRGGHRKRVHALPFVLERVREEAPGARLRIVGFDFSEEPALRDAFAAKGLTDAVECLGAIPASALPAHYRAARVLVVPSAYEGLPLVIVEAMQCGLPVVATNVAGHPEAIDEGITGHLVPLDEPRVLGERCASLLADPASRDAMGRRAREVAVERFSMADHVGAYLALYRRLCEDAA